MTVAVTALSGGASINTAGLMDALIKVDRAWQMLADPDGEPAFRVGLVGLRDGPIECRDGVVLHPHAVADRLDPILPSSRASTTTSSPRSSSTASGLL